MKRTDVPGGSALTRQRSPIGDSQNDEEWGDDLFNTVIRRDYL